MMRMRDLTLLVIPEGYNLVVHAFHVAAGELMRQGSHNRGFIV